MTIAERRGLSSLAGVDVVPNGVLGWMPPALPRRVSYSVNSAAVCLPPRNGPGGGLLSQ